MAFHHIFLTFLSFGTLINTLSGVEDEVLVHPGVIHHLFFFLCDILHKTKQNTLNQANISSDGTFSGQVIRKNT